MTHQLHVCVVSSTEPDLNCAVLLCMSCYSHSLRCVYMQPDCSVCVCWQEAQCVSAMTVTDFKDTYVDL